MKHRLAFIAVVSQLVSASIGVSQELPCNIVLHPNPQGGTIDLVEWMTMSADLRGDHHLDNLNPAEGHPLGCLSWGNKIIWTKFAEGVQNGNWWDTYAFDEDYVYLFFSGNKDSFWAPAYETAVPHAPRYPQLGSPGTRLIANCNTWTWFNNCVPEPSTEGARNIQDVYGIETEDLGGNIGTVDVVKIRYYQHCTTFVPESCSHYEENWYAKPYGWVKFSWYLNMGSGNFVQQVDRSTFNQLVTGGSNYDACF